MYKTEKRHKINFMVSNQIIIEMENLIPKGQRSDFVNKALQKELRNLGREKAIEEMDKMAKKIKLKTTTKEIIKLKNYGRL